MTTACLSLDSVFFLPTVLRCSGLFMHTELDANDNSLLSLESGLFLSTVLRSSGLFMHTELDANDNSFVESRIWYFSTGRA
jgi:hypothetical protein